MDELLKTVILGAPNLAVAILTLYWCFRSLDRKDEATQKLVDELLKMCATNANLVAQMGEASKLSPDDIERIRAEVFGKNGGKVEKP